MLQGGGKKMQHSFAQPSKAEPKLGGSGSKMSLFSWERAIDSF